MSEPIKEPEDLVSNAKYLLELIQMDLNFGRKETIPARAKQALFNVFDLTKIYPLYKAEESLDSESAQKLFLSKNYSTERPNSVGLYSVVCGESNWEPSKVAITINDYKILIVHCADIGTRPLEQYHANLEGTMWLRLA